MMIRGLKLRNFVSHKETEVAFHRGLTAIVGDNGAGKTALLDAITYALYKEHGRGNDENLINRRADSAEVSLTFSVGGREYSVSWKIARRRSPMALATLRDLSTGRAILDGVGERSAVRELESLIGVPKEVFMNAIYVRQGEIALLLEMKPAERKRTIGELLGLGLLEDLWKSLSTPIARLEERKESYERDARREEEIEGNLRSKSERLSALREELARSEEELRVLLSEKEKLERRLGELDRMRRTIERLRSERDAISKRAAAKEVELEGIKRDLEKIVNAAMRLEELLIYEKRYESCSMELEKLQEELENLTKQVSSLRAVEEALSRAEMEIERAEQEISAYVKELSELSGQELEAGEFVANYSAVRRRLEEEIKRLEEELAEIDREVGERENVLRRDEELISTLVHAGDRCPLCGQELSPKHKDAIIYGLKEEVTRVREEIERLLMRRTALVRRREDVRERFAKLLTLDLKKFEEALRRHGGAVSEVERLKHEISDLKLRESALEEGLRRREELKNELEELARLHEEYLKARGIMEEVGRPEELKARIYRIESELRDLGADVRRIDDELRSMGFDDTEFEDTLRRLREISEKVRDLSGRVERSRMEKGYVERELETLGVELERVRDARAKAEKLAVDIELLRIIRETFGKDGIQREVRRVAREQIERHARRFLQMLNVEYSDLRLDEDYNVYLYGPHGEQSIDAISGGEKVSVALALRLAIAATLAGDRLECIIMDEPTVHLDQEKRRGLVRLLENFRMERGVLPQVIVVTHDREIEEVSDYVYEVRKIGGFSVVNSGSS